MESREKKSDGQWRRSSGPAKRLRGTIAVPGDKSISHRAAILNALAERRKRGPQLPAGRRLPFDTWACLRALGAKRRSTKAATRRCCASRVSGLHGLREAADVLDCGNCGTTMRLMSGVLAGHPFLSILTGDASLRSRPMARVRSPCAGWAPSVGARGRACTAGDSRRQPAGHPVPSAGGERAGEVLGAPRGTVRGGRDRRRGAGAYADHTERMLAAWVRASAAKGRPCT